MTKILKAFLVLSASIGVGAHAEGQPQFVDCSANAGAVAQSIAASTPAAKAGPVMPALLLHTSEFDANGDFVEVGTKDLDPHHPARSYYVEISYPVPGESQEGMGRRQVGNYYRIAYQDGKYAQPEAAAAYQKSCYLMSIDQIRLPR